MRRRNFSQVILSHLPVIRIGTSQSDESVTSRETRLKSRGSQVSTAISGDAFPNKQANDAFQKGTSEAENSRAKTVQNKLLR